MSLRKLKENYPEIFTEEKYPEQDAGDPGVSMEYYINEIIGLDDYTYDDCLGKYKLIYTMHGNMVLESKGYIIKHLEGENKKEIIAELNELKPTTGGKKSRRNKTNKKSRKNQ